MLRHKSKSDCRGGGFDAGGLEHAARHDVQHPSGYGNVAWVAVVQDERCAVAVPADGEGVSGGPNYATRQIKWIFEVSP